ncbi:MAG: hypothetical protein RLZZ157_1874 [Pseudomonadota bacterium]|jgi:hypothetical protein
MPYSTTNLQVRGPIPSASSTGAGAQPMELFYTTSDAIATVEAANYFNAGAEYFGVGPNILNVVSTTGPIGRIYVATRVGGVITLTRFSQTAAV